MANRQLPEISSWQGSAGDRGFLSAAFRQNPLHCCGAVASAVSGVDASVTPRGQGLWSGPLWVCDGGSGAVPSPPLRRPCPAVFLSSWPLSSHAGAQRTSGCGGTGVAAPPLLLSMTERPSCTFLSKKVHLNSSPPPPPTLPLQIPTANTLRLFLAECPQCCK